MTGQVDWLLAIQSTVAIQPLLADREWYGLTVGSLWLALILVMLAGAIKMTKMYRRNGFRVLGIFSGNEAEGAQDAHLSLTKFRELHARGGLSDDEYRIIKTKLASELQSTATADADAKPPTDPTSPTPAAPAPLAGDTPAADAAGPVVEPVSDRVTDLTDESK